MEDNYFLVFVEMLRLLERYNLAGASIEGAIISLMDKYEHQLTPDQKNTLLREFVDYEEKREQALEMKRKEMESKTRSMEGEDSF